MEIIKQATTLDYKSNMSFEQKQLFRTLYSEKSLTKGITWNIIYLLSIYLALILSYEAVQRFDSIVVTFVAVFIGVLFITRQMRGLENIVHFGSHNNFTKNKKLNDFLTNAFSAWPMLQDVKSYRGFHATHHGDFASDKDPCRIRLEKIGANTQKIENNMQLLMLIAKWMPQYEREFYREIKSNGNQVIVFIAWHAFVGMILTLLHSWQLAVFVTFSWTLIMFTTLPFLRSIAELSEHDYELGKTVTETTFNNLGLLDHLFIHPAGDAWHSLHHLHPTVPWWKQGAAHKFLMKNDVAYQRVINRDDLLQDLVQFPTKKQNHV